MVRKAALSLLAAGIVLSLGVSAEALTISMAMASAKNGGNTADSNVFPNGNVSTATVTAAGGTDLSANISDTLTSSGRYFGGLWRDTGVGTASTLNANYRITLTMTADPGLVYDVQITHDLEGVVQRNSPGFLNSTCDGPCAATLSNVLATVVNNGGGTVGGTLVQASATGGSGTGDAETDVTVAAAIFNITGLVGSQTLQIDFTFTATVAGTNTNDCTSARFGVPGPGTALANECEYSTTAGVGDGHFVTATSTITAIIPEPSVAVLTTLGLAGLGFLGRRRSV